MASIADFFNRIKAQLPSENGNGSWLNPQKPQQLGQSGIETSATGVRTTTPPPIFNNATPSPRFGNAHEGQGEDGADEDGLGDGLGLFGNLMNYQYDPATGGFIDWGLNPSDYEKNVQTTRRALTGNSSGDESGNGGGGLTQDGGGEQANGAGTTNGSDASRQWTLSGQLLSNDDEAGRAAAKMLDRHQDWGYGDDYGRFQTEGTYDQWRDVLSDPEMRRYYQNILTDERFQGDGGFDFDKYWDYTENLTPSRYGDMDYDDWLLMNGSSAGAMHSYNSNLAGNSEATNMLGLGQDILNAAINGELSDEQINFLNGQYDNIADRDSIIRYLDNAGLSYGGMRNGDSYSEDELNYLMGALGEGGRFTYGNRGDAHEDFANLPGGEGYNPYMSGWSIDQINDMMSNGIGNNYTGSALRKGNGNVKWYEA